VSDALFLCYHALSERWTSDLSIRPELLERQLRLLVARGYRGATFGDAVAGAAAGRTLAVTFDDAFSSVFRLARPILAELGLPGTVFVPTSFAEGGLPLRWPGIEQWSDGPHAEELTAMSWEELAELADEGWEVGSHTRTHPRLTTLDHARLMDELRGSREACERALDRPCRSIAYPYGDVDDRVSDAARAAGYAAGAALPEAPHAFRPLEVPRIGVYEKDRPARFRIKVSPLVRRARVGLARARSRS
jgi:peptidoglycan/xylan/chitin deacetylase (PgdA/CDA1 family)